MSFDAGEKGAQFRFPFIKFPIYSIQSDNSQVCHLTSPVNGDKKIPRFAPLLSAVSHMTDSFN